MLMRELLYNRDYGMSFISYDCHSRLHPDRCLFILDSVSDYTAKTPWILLIDFYICANNSFTWCLYFLSLLKLITTYEKRKQSYRALRIICRVNSTVYFCIALRIRWMLLILSRNRPNTYVFPVLHDNVRLVGCSRILPHRLAHMELASSH